MKKMITLAIVAAALGMPGVAIAQTTGVEQTQWGDFANRGQCQSRLMQLRNEYRQNPPASETRSSSEINQYNRENFSCQQRADGRYAIYFG